MTDAEIEAMKERINESLEDAEACAFSLEMWLIDWRARMAEKQARERA
jgi:hypothetical protein